MFYYCVFGMFAVTGTVTFVLGWIGILYLMRNPSATPSR
jgi:hypothetical protein